MLIRHPLRARLIQALAATVIGAAAMAAADGGRLQAATADTDASLDALAAQVDGRTAASNSALHQQYLQRLTTVQAATAQCARFFGKHGDNPKVIAIIRQATASPGDQFFTEPEIIGRLERAVGGSIDLTQRDLETCLQVQDRGPPLAFADKLGGRIGAMDASLRKCIASLKATGPNAAGLAILERVARHPSDDSFTSAKTLSRLEQAVGDLKLTPRDLETCTDAFDQDARFAQVTVVGDNPSSCPSGETYCQVNIVSSTCCAAGQTCHQVCGGRDGCSGYCASPGCFPADATVTTESGATKAMTEVRLGDRLLTARPDGTLGYEEVYLNAHRDAQTAAAYVVLDLASGRTLRLTPRHFIPVATDPAASWSQSVTKGADEVQAGDYVWSRTDDGSMALDRVVTAATRVAVGAFNPLTMNGTIVVDGVVASAHSDWFLDGLVPAQAQARVYQAVLAPVRLAYRALGPARMTAITEEWGVVDAVREATVPGGRAAGLGWTALALALVAGGGFLALRRRRLPGH